MEEREIGEVGDEKNEKVWKISSKQRYDKIKR